MKKRIMSIILAVLILLTTLNIEVFALTLSESAPYDGDYIIAYNTSTNIGSSSNSGTFFSNSSYNMSQERIQQEQNTASSQIPEEEEDTGELVPIEYHGIPDAPVPNPLEERLRNSVNFDTQIFASQVDDKRSFIANDFTASGSLGGGNYKTYNVPSTLMYIGDYCEVWVEDAEVGTNKMDYAKAQQIGETFDLYRNDMLNDFGSYLSNEYYGARDGRIIIFVHDIKDPYNDGGSSYYAGYFSNGDYITTAEHSSATGNQLAMIHIDTCPAMGIASYNPTNIRTTLMHEFTHLINYSVGRQYGRGAQEYWINEGLAVAAEDLCFGTRTGRLNEYYYSTAVKNGAILTYNDYAQNNNDGGANYGMPYLFMKYLNAQTKSLSGGGYEIYKKIIASSFGDYRSVQNALTTVGYSETNFSNLNRNFRIATLARENSGLYSFKGDQVVAGISDAIAENLVYTAETGKSLRGTEALILKKNGRTVLGTGMGAQTKYCGFSILPKVAFPTATPDGGLIPGSNKVTLTCGTSGASIRYTTDGTDPTPTTGTLYTTPIPISKDTELRVIAYKSGMESSLVLTFYYYAVPITSIQIPASLNLNKNGTYQLSPDYLPADASSPEFDYSVDNSTIASVNANGLITAKAGGQTKIYAKDKNNPSVFAECIVTVVVPLVSMTVSAVNPPEYLFEGETVQLKANFTPSDTTMTNIHWASNNPTVATVSTSGLVTAQTASASAPATITATCADDPTKTATIQIWVDKRPVGLSFDQTTLTLERNSEYTLIPTFVPPGTTLDGLTWSTSNNAVATVSASGKVTAKAPGTATIRAKSNVDSSVEAICVVTVVVSLQTLTLNQNTATIEKGLSQKINITKTPVDATDTIEWSSSNPSVATVDQTGNITAKAAGTATIKVASVQNPDKFALCEVTVTIPVTKLDMNKTTAAIIRGQYENLSVKYTPLDTTENNVTWTSSHPAIATVDQTGKVTAIAPGTATIKATSVTRPAISTTCTVTVEQPITGLNISKTNMAVQVGGTGQLVATIEPADGSAIYQWSSSNNAVATVDNTGLVTGKATGTATITVTVGALTKTCTVTVMSIKPLTGLTLSKTSLSVTKGSSATLTATKTPADAKNPDGTDITIKWSSNNTTVATVDAFGKITAKATGTATITASCDQYPGITAQCVVTVTTGSNDDKPGPGPSPSSNPTPTPTETVAASPQASPRAGAINKGDKVTLTTTTSGASIYYTIDGTAPTTSSILYTGPIEITQNVTIKAIAAKSGLTNSPVVTFEYTIKTDVEPGPSPNFTDISNYPWASNEINTLASLGVIKGISDTEYGPGLNIKRGDFVLLLMRLLKMENEPFTDNFQDVPATSYYYKAIGAAKAKGLVNGIDESHFNPEAKISRQDMFVMAYRVLLSLGLIEAPGDHIALMAFKDRGEIANYALDAFAAFVQNGIVQGNGDTINPRGNATRAETAVFMKKIYDKLNM